MNNNQSVWKWLNYIQQTPPYLKSYFKWILCFLYTYILFKCYDLQSPKNCDVMFWKGLKALTCSHPVSTGEYTVWQQFCWQAGHVRIFSILWKGINHHGMSHGYQDVVDPTGFGFVRDGLQWLKCHCTCISIIFHLKNSSMEGKTATQNWSHTVWFLAFCLSVVHIACIL